MDHERAGKQLPIKMNKQQKQGLLKEKKTSLHESFAREMEQTMFLSAVGREIFYYPERDWMNLEYIWRYEDNIAL